MSTRQEELQNLKTIYSAITQIEKLEERISKKEELIEEQKARYVEEYPEYLPEEYEQKEKESIKAKRYDKAITTNFFVALLPVIAFLIYQIVILCKEEYVIIGIIMWSCIYLAPLIFLVLGMHGIAISSVCYFLGALFLHIFIPNRPLQIKFNLATGVLLVLIYLVWLACVLIYMPFRRKKEKRILAIAKAKDEQHLRDYEEKKKIADIEIEKKKIELDKEVASIIAREKETIEQLKKEIKEKQHIISATPGLAPQDKNLYTVSTLINYFERGKADSIKEAINIFDLEEREKARDSERRTAQFIADMERRAALDRMEREQREYNQAILDSTRRMEQEQKEHNEKIQKELDDIKNGR